MTTSLKYEDFELPFYRNSAPITNIGGVELNLVDVTLATLGAGLNIFFAGEKGEGKTQLQTDIYNQYFGAEGVLMRGNKDLTVKKFYQQLNLGAINTAKTEREIYVATRETDYHVVIIDELNRCPPITQQEFFNLCDGYIERFGKKIPLGGGEYIVGIASGNIGNGAYVGTFEVDSALWERFHTFLDFSAHQPTLYDRREILHRTKIDPRVVDSNPMDNYAKILELNKKITGQKPSLEFEILNYFLTVGMNWCKLGGIQHNKKNLKNWPSACKQDNCDRESTVCGKMKAISPRSATAYIGLAIGMEEVARLKEPETLPTDAFELSALHVHSFYEALRLAGSYSTELNHMYVRQDNYNNPTLALNNLVQDLKQSTDNMAQAISIATEAAVSDRMQQKYMDPFQGEWAFFLDILADIESKKIELEG